MAISLLGWGPSLVAAAKGHPALHVLDSTDAGAIRAVQKPGKVFEVN